MVNKNGWIIKQNCVSVFDFKWVCIIEINEILMIRMGNVYKYIVVDCDVEKYVVYFCMFYF